MEKRAYSPQGNNDNESTTERLATIIDTLKPDPAHHRTVIELQAIMQQLVHLNQENESLRNILGYSPKAKTI